MTLLVKLEVFRTGTFFQRLSLGIQRAAPSADLLHLLSWLKVPDDKAEGDGQTPDDHHPQP